MVTKPTSRGGEDVITNDRPLVTIGERINPTGRSVLTAEMRAGVMGSVRADAEAQVAAGAQVLDVNAGIPGVDEPALLVTAIRAVMEVTDVPICIDSSSVEALEAGLAAHDGKALVNSVNAEEERMEAILPLVRRHGAAVIGIVSDGSRIPTTPHERLALARQILGRARDHGISQEDVIFDPIVLPLGVHPAGRSVTLETIRLIRYELGCNITCGLSNISFGLPDRASLNSAFLKEAIGAGLTCAIANPLELRGIQDDAIW